MNYDHIKLTDDIELKKLSPDNAQEVYDLICKNRNYLKEWLPWLDTVKEVSDTRSFLEMMSKKEPLVHGLDMHILFKGKIAGIINFHAIDKVSRTSSLGYWLGEEFCGNGIMTRAAKCLVDFGFKELNLNSIRIQAASENLKSRAIPERLGFKLDGILRQREWLYDHFVDHAVYSLLKNEWDQSL